MNGQKTLLEKYAIPIENLDFDYIKSCGNIREMEKIVEILRSGEEGYYPDLTSFAEKKLNELDPNNRMLRTEVRCLTTGSNEKQEINWDKYDADTECLKMDLQEEQTREKSLLEQKRQQKQLIEVLSEEAIPENISEIEKTELAEKHRVKGNEFFKCSEYQQAIAEYNRSLIYLPTAAVYNNRAVAYLKLKKYDLVIRDCDECLKRDATNIKAMLRKCDALIATDRKNEAYRLYSEVLKYEPENSVAKKALKNISIRLEIQDVNTQPKQSERVFLETPDNQGDDNDFYRKLIIT